MEETLIVKTRRIARNSIILSAGQIANKGLSLAFIAIIARALGVADFGKYAIVMATAGMFVVLPDFGLTDITIREVSRDKKRASSYFVNVGVVRAILSVLAYPAFIGFLHLMGYDNRTVNTGYVVGLAVFLDGFVQLSISLFRAMEKMEFEVGLLFLRVTLSLILAVLALKFGLGLIGVAGSLLIGSLLALVFGFLFTIRKFSIWRSKLDLALWRKTLAAATPIGCVYVLGMIHWRTDVTILAHFDGDQAVGFYGAAQRIFEAFRLIPYAVMGAAFPVLASSFALCKRDMVRVYTLLSRFFVIIGLPLAMGITLLSDRIIRVVYAEQYSRSIPSLQILAWAVPLIYMSGIGSAMLVSMNMQSSLMKLSLVCAAVSLGLNFLLIPRFGIVGASWTTVAWLMISAIWSYVLVGRHLLFLPLHRLSIRPVGASLCMAGLILLFADMPLVLLVPLSIAAYFLVLAALHEFTSDDFGLLREIIPRGLVSRFLFREDTLPEDPPRGGMREETEDLGDRWHKCS